MTKCSCNKFHSRKFYSNHCKPHFVIQKVSSFLKKKTHTISLNRITHFAHKCDIQTAAMLCCAFGRHCPSADVSRSSSLSGKSLNGSVSYKCCKNLLERGQKIHIKCTKLTFSLIIYIYLFLFIWFFFVITSHVHISSNCTHKIFKLFLMYGRNQFFVCGGIL